MNKRRWSLALLGEDSGDQDEALNTDQTIEADSSDDPDDDIENNPQDSPSEGVDNPQDNPLTDPNVPPEDRPRPEEIGLSTDKVVEQSEQIRKDEELEQAKEDK